MRNKQEHALPQRPNVKSAEAKLQAVIDTIGKTAQEQAEYCRAHGIYSNHLDTWKAQMLEGLGAASVNTKTLKAEHHQITNENKQLKRDLHCKDKALAEVSALLVLKKKSRVTLEDNRRGRLINAQDKHELINLINEAQQAGARLELACEALGINIRTLQRWNKDTSLEDKRCCPINSPANKLTTMERARILEVVNAPEYRDKPPSQIVPRLADNGTYVCSEATMYRILHEHHMLQHRSASRPKTHTKPDALVATKPNQLWSWDITFLRSSIRGQFYYLYMFMDIYSRKIVGF